MNEKAAALARVAAASAVFLAAAGCGHSAAPSADPSSEASGSAPATSTERLAATMAGVGVVFSGPPPIPATPSACIRRWNSSANAPARRSAVEADAPPLSALVRIGKATDYFGADGRCIVWIAARHEPTTAIIFVERAPSVFANAGAASRPLVTPDLAVDDQGRIAA